MARIACDPVRMGHVVAGAASKVAVVGQAVRIHMASGADNSIGMDHLMARSAPEIAVILQPVDTLVAS